MGLTEDSISLRIGFERIHKEMRRRDACREQLEAEVVIQGLFVIFVVQLSIELGFTFRTDTVAEICQGMIFDIGLDLVPITLVIADLLAVTAYGQESAKGLDIVQRFLKGFGFLVEKLDISTVLKGYGRKFSENSGDL